MSEKRSLILLSLGIVILAVAVFVGLPYELGKFVRAH